MAIPTSAEAMGQVFSEITVSYETRKTLSEAVFIAARDLLVEIEKEHCAELMATGNAEITDWDDFRGNGVSPNQSGINDDVQAKGEALYTALNALS